MDIVSVLKDHSIIENNSFFDTRLALLDISEPNSSFNAKKMIALGEYIYIASQYDTPSSILEKFNTDLNEIGSGSYKQNILFYDMATDGKNLFIAGNALYKFDLNLKEIDYTYKDDIDSIIYYDGFLYVSSSNDHIEKIDPETLKVVAKSETFTKAPIKILGEYNGKIYFNRVDKIYELTMETMKLGREVLLNKAYSGIDKYCIFKNNIFAYVGNYLFKINLENMNIVGMLSFLDLKEMYVAFNKVFYKDKKHVMKELDTNNLAIKKIHGTLNREFTIGINKDSYLYAHHRNGISKLGLTKVIK